MENLNELYVTIGSGGSIGENHNLGHFRIFGSYAYTNKEQAKAQTRKCVYRFGGGYYDYRYSTKTLSWAKKNCEKYDDKAITIVDKIF